MVKAIEVIARGVCVSGSRILLCQTRGAANTYLPGGHVEFKETARMALEREIEEELGLPSTVGRFLGAAEHSFRQKGKRHCEWNAVFELGIPGLEADESIDAAEDHIRFLWCELDALKQAKLEPSVLCDLLPQWLGDAFAGERWACGGDFA